MVILTDQAPQGVTEKGVTDKIINTGKRIFLCI